MPIATIIITIALTVLLLALIYAAAQRLWPRQNNAAQEREAGAPWIPARAPGERLEYPSMPPHVEEIPDPVPDRSPDLTASNPKILGRLRSGREGDRPSEDDLAQLHVGRLGRPGERTAANALPENITQIPKPLDPGHTA
jgi:hypothetical protein